MEGREILAFACALGEVRTTLLRNSTGVLADQAQRLVSIVPGRTTEFTDYPIAKATSPTILTGVDCEVAPSTGAVVRTVGTAASRVTLMGGHVLQASSHVTLRPSEAGRRLPWGHYTADPGVLEVIGKTAGQGIVDSFLSTATTRHLNLGAISSRLVDLVQRHESLDGRTAVRSGRGTLRWAVLPTESATVLTVETRQRDLRAIRLGYAADELGPVIELFEDVARYDWLLATAMAVEERTRRLPSRTDAFERVRAAVETLPALWMPPARSTPLMAELWQAFDHHSGLSGQWRAVIERLRDRMVLGALDALTSGAGDRFAIPSMRDR